MSNSGEIQRAPSIDPANQRAIDCLATHDITHGTSPTTYDPSGTVPRWQMALFLVRQATAHGMTIPAAVDQGYTDLGGPVPQPGTRRQKQVISGFTS